MNLGNLKTLARAYMPGAKKNVVTDSTLGLILNEGAKDIAIKTMCLPTSVKFSSVAGQQEYNLSIIATRFAEIDKPGIWYKQSSTDDYRQLLPKTIKWLDRRLGTWRNVGSGTTRYYAQYGDVVVMYETPDATVSNAYHMYYTQYPLSMTTDSHYPFGNLTEIERLTSLSDVILLFWEWKASKILGDSEQVIEAKHQQYITTMHSEKKRLSRLPDINASKYTKFQGRSYREL